VHLIGFLFIVVIADARNYEPERNTVLLSAAIVEELELIWGCEWRSRQQYGMEIIHYSTERIAFST
jgi:hypothetical protein